MQNNLGYRFPEEYRSFLQSVGSGDLKDDYRWIDGYFGEAWPTGVEVDRIFGNSTDSNSSDLSIDGASGTEYLTAEWGYPDLGIVLAHSDSAGPDAFLLISPVLSILRIQ
ncbi:MAG TPA: hypothetical protein H9870_12780 [Candidatus Corynebacterium avicola]|uniref:Knr4/Smi1-like domain-containing protein n=1 Tax=Candidatus Corynebacterium avicola TaxID=2838527 RepID=A0A9D1ULN3_9CORY|nr:hypothetical protein [Candidatus Corynebacterium avicola]